MLNIKSQADNNSTIEPQKPIETTSAQLAQNPLLAAGLIQRTQFYIIVSPKDVIQIHTMSWLRKEAIAKFTSGSVYTWVDCKNNGWSCEKFDVSFKKVK